MFTDAEMRKLFESVMDRMIKCGWLHSYFYTDGKGFHLNWTERGTFVSQRLKLWDSQLSLHDGDTCPILACELVHDGRLPAPLNVTTAEKVLDGLLKAGYASTARVDVPAGLLVVDYTPAGVRFRQEFREFIAELGLPRTEDDLLTLFIVASGWAPDANTPIRFY